MHDAAQAGSVAGADVPRGEGVDAAPHPDEEPRKEQDERRAGADGAERLFTGKSADDGDIRHIEKDLQDVGEHEWQAEKDNILKKRTLGHIDGSLFHSLRSPEKRDWRLMWCAVKRRLAETASAWRTRGHPPGAPFVLRAERAQAGATLLL